MLTALTIKTIPNDTWYKKLFYKVKGNSIKVEIKSARGVPLRHIIYQNCNGKVDWFKLNSVIGPQRNHLLCSEDIVLPADLGFKRFDNREFKMRLAVNLGIFILSKLQDKSKNIKIGFYDVKGECKDMLGDIVKYSSDITVVTDNLTVFNYEAKKIYEDIGATVQVTDNRVRLMDCQLIIAPEQIKELLPLSGSTIVLSSAPPTVCTAGLVYYDYYFRMPNKFDAIKPEELTEEYFAGALYTKARQYELGSIVPTTCCNYSSSQTYRSICDYLIKTAEKE